MLESFDPFKRESGEKVKKMNGIEIARQKTSYGESLPLEDIAVASARADGIFVNTFHNNKGELKEVGEDVLLKDLSDSIKKKVNRGGKQTMMQDEEERPAPPVQYNLQEVENRYRKNARARNGKQKQQYRPYRESSL